MITMYVMTRIMITESDPCHNIYYKYLMRIWVDLLQSPSIMIRLSTAYIYVFMVAAADIIEWNRTEHRIQRR